MKTKTPMAPKISPHLLQSKLRRRFQPAVKIELASLATPQPKSANDPPHSEVVAAEPLKVVDIPVADLLPVADKCRINDRTVSNLVESFTAVGLIQPISVSRDTGQAGKWKLHGGAHRVLAAHKVGWTTIQALVFDREAEDLALIEIAENLHRKDLSIMERARLQNRWLEIVRQRDVQVAQPGGRQPNDKGYGKAARLCDGTREEMRRSEAIARIPGELISHILEHKLDNNQRALLEIAKITGVEAQIEKVHELAARKRSPERQRRSKSENGAAEVTVDEPHAQTLVPPLLQVEFPALPAYLDRRDADEALADLTQEWMASRLRIMLLDSPTAARLRFLSEKLLPEIGATARAQSTRQIALNAGGASDDA
jgi:ParB/RepB/Spo0J family partition protein